MSEYATCTEGVTRGDAFQPCDGQAVAMRIDPEEKKPYPVCSRHCRGEMVPLNEVKAQAVEKAANSESDWRSGYWHQAEAETVVKIRKGLLKHAQRIRQGE